MSAKRYPMLVLVIAMCLLMATAGLAQSIISGELTGTVEDPTGAVLPNITVKLMSDDTGAVQTTTTTPAGFFRFALLKPGNYTLSVTAPSFAPAAAKAVVAVGQVINVPIKLDVAGAKETVQVTAELAMLQTENANLTSTYDRVQIENLPMPGQDMTGFALSSPGVTLATGGGYGNFTAFGLPGTSNVYTVNGSDNNDPFNGLANSGASNNTLGVNELSDLSIVTNGYTGQYGRGAGANINYATKSGTNAFHGNATWYWNGSAMNANDWFNNNTATERPFANSNQWAGSIGGPIKKDKLFFFFDSEGLRYILPAGGPAYIPTTQFQAATLAHLAATQPGAVPFYNTAFNLYNGSFGFGRATPLTAAVDPFEAGASGLGCGDLAGTPYGAGILGDTIPCALTFQNTANSKNTERLMSVRVDLIATQNDKLSFRYWQNRGDQATYTDAINPVFNTGSHQPQDNGQLTYTRVISPMMVNQFIAAGSYYSAIFKPANIAASLAAFPTTLRFGDGAPFSNLGGRDYNYPQGRNVTQYQFVDDFSWTRGEHNLKFGMNIRRNNITDLTPFRNTTGYLLFNSMTDFYDGVMTPNVSRLTQLFTSQKEVPFAMYSLGVYAQDEWRASDKLKLTFALRLDRNSNVTCRTNCFSEFAGSFSGFLHNANVPYNQVIGTGLSQAFPKMEKLVWQPRIGFAYTPFKSGNTVLRGGFGIFSDLYPGQIAERFVQAPYVANFNVTSGGSAVPTVAGNVWTKASTSYGALVNGFAAGQTYTQINTAAGGNFVPPSFSSSANTFSNPKYMQWNFQVEQALGPKMAMTLNYVGNHGYDLINVNGGVNTYCTTAATKCPNGFASLPASAPDSRFGRVNEINNAGVSNYNGFTASLTRRMTKGFSGSINYTWSHTLDDVSNGGLQYYDQYDSLMVQIDPNNLRRFNYASSDYDFRHVLSLNYVWELPFKSSNGVVDQFINGWAISGTLYDRSGAPYTPYFSSFSRLSNATIGAAGAGGAGNYVMGWFLGGGTPGCGAPSKNSDNPYTCLEKSQFLASSAQNDFGNRARNGFRGPMYFNSDMTITKSFKLTEGGMKLMVGVNAFNVFNHPNFANPDAPINGGTFGLITSTVVPASSPYGNFQGSAVSGRLLQTQIRFQF